MGNERQTASDDPWLSFARGRLWLHWGQVQIPSSSPPQIFIMLANVMIRSVKWLARIDAIAEPSRAPVQKTEYLYCSPQCGKHNATYSSGFSIQDMPVSSTIMYSTDKSVIVHDGKITMRGWAYSGGGH